MRHAHAERGSTLIVSLLILIVMTLIGITGMGSSSLQERMAGNSRDMALAFQAAEAALRDGETYYEDTVVSLGAAFNGSNPGLYQESSNPSLFEDATWSNARVYGADIDGVFEPPRYIIELIGEISEENDSLNVQGYGESSGIGSMTSVRVTARGVGGTENAVVYLQSNYVNRN